jgi:NAD-dependent SIR2 family protein deacetylase
LSPTDIERLYTLLRGRRVVALTGAGASTESGIPDYRGPETRRRAKDPIQGRAFVNDAATRRRYWARSVVGWPRIATARPNPGHLALAELEGAGAVAGVITQNVDRLHQAAGSRRVVELHGTVAEARCLDCASIEPRAALQARLLALNPAWSEREADSAPDGDADIDAEASFVVADCRACGGALKPNVVFFGETVPRPIVDAAYSLLAEAEALLVVGSSLAVFSGYRFVRAAHARAIPIAIVNLGPARGDELAAVRVDGRSGVALPALASALAKDERATWPLR